MPKIAGDKVQVTVYLDPALYMKIEKTRGQVKKSTFIEGLVESGMKKNSNAC